MQDELRRVNNELLTLRTVETPQNSFFRALRLCKQPLRALSRWLSKKVALPPDVLSRPPLLPPKPLTWPTNPSLLVLTCRSQPLAGTLPLAQENILLPRTYSITRYP
jgi:hypothetical protein